MEKINDALPSSLIDEKNSEYYNWKDLPPDPMDQSSPERRKARFSDVVSTIITYRQKGIQTIIFQSVAILVSITILFLLTQVYYIFLPCLKALLWALLCGSALYPFKIRLESLLKQWLDDLDAKNRSFSVGVMLLPIQLFIAGYAWIIEFIVYNKLVFFLFHFRYQIGEICRIFLEIILPILSLHRGIVTTMVIVAATIQFFAVLFSSSQNVIQFVLSFSFLPTFLLLCMLYFSLNIFNLIGEVVFIVFAGISLIGFFATVYKLLYGPREKATIHEELNAFIAVLGERVRTKLEDFIVSIQKRLNLEDSVDGHEMSIGNLYMRLLFIIFVFAILENMNLSNLVLAVFCVHSIIRRIFKTVCLSRLVQWTGDVAIVIRNFIIERFKRDKLFGLFLHFFVQGDEIIRAGLHHRLDLLTSITLFGIVAMMITVSSVFLSIKIYGECYSAVDTLQNELKSIEFIQESLNLTLNKISDPDYLNGLIFSEKLNLRDDEKIFLNKMLVQFRSNILPYFSVMNNSTSSNGNQTDGGTETNGTVTNSLKMISMLDFSVMDYTDFGQIASLVTSQANAYLPLLKSFLSFSYAFLFVILDSSTFLLGFVINFIIFALALFYLLSLSHDRYKPIEFMDHIVSSLTVTPEQDTRFSEYVEQVINSIFAATLKISAFYGVYTWLLHSLFGFRICFIPSVIAAILAAVPLLNAYWASVPACIYLYYFDPNLYLVKSLSMFILAILPSLIVDSTIYSDIEKGGHPYLTGLAITCGVVYYGVEGALLGPLWLCLLMIILNMCAEFDANIINTLTP